MARKPPGQMTPLIFRALLFSLALSEEVCEEDQNSLLQASKEATHFRGTPNETLRALPALLARGDVFPYEMMTCPGEQALTTRQMLSSDYDAVIAKVQGLYNGLSKKCDGDVCPQADWAGCVLRIAGHDFMDYVKKDGRGGSDGCLDLSDPDNAGLADCMYQGADHGVSIADAYVDFCEKVSLADFVVMAANAVIKSTREEVLKKYPTRKPFDLKSVFRYGRTTLKRCSWAVGRLPNPENSCADVKKVFVNHMGLSWKEAAALMGVHTLGRGHKGNSGYDGWWSDSKNSRMFNNDYFVSLGAKGWGPDKKVGGNAMKNQWVRVDKGLKKEERTGKEMMLNTDMCLVWTNDGSGKVDMNAKTAPKYGCNCAWIGPLEAPNGWKKYKDGEFCGSKNVPDDFNEGWPKQRNNCCGVMQSGGDGVDCGDPRYPKGPAWNYVKAFMLNEDTWLSAFSASWKVATENGFQGLKRLR